MFSDDVYFVEKNDTHFLADLFYKKWNFVSGNCNLISLLLESRDWKSCYHRKIGFYDESPPFLPWVSHPTYFLSRKDRQTCVSKRIFLFTQTISWRILSRRRSQLCLKQDKKSSSSKSAERRALSNEVNPVEDPELKSSQGFFIEILFSPSKVKG